MELENLDISYWIILLITALVFGIIGYFFGKSQGNSKELENVVEDLRRSNSKLQADLSQCQERLDEQSAQLSNQEFQFNPQAAKAAFGRFIKEDDLKIVEGIGPKIEGLFHNYNIKTWRDLAGTSVAKCREVLDSGGEKYRVHDPASWPMQARMCYEGKWKDLYRWQEEHLHGKL